MSEKETRAEQADDARQDQEFLLRLAAKMGRVAKGYEERGGRGMTPGQRRRASFVTS